MSERFIPSLAKAAIKAVPVGVGLGLAAVGGIEAVYHRKGAHDVLKTPQLLDEAFRLEQKSMGIPFVGEWEAVHRIGHHTKPDMFLKYAYDIWRAWQAFVTTHPHSDFQLPKSVPYIDPYISQFPMEALLKVGELEEVELASRMGSNYEEKKHCSQEELEALVHPTKPTYYYPPRVKHPKGYEYSQDEKARAVGSDPHSFSLLHPQEAFFREHFGLYQDRANVFLADPSLKDPDLHREGENDRKSALPYIIGGVALPALITLGARRKMSLGDLFIAGAVGGSIYGERAWTEVQAGKFVNFFGHLGDIDEETLNAILTNKLFYLKPNPDGTVSSDLINAGWKGRVIGFMTGGDAGKQRRHHIKPEENLFSAETGIRAFAEDPIGFSLEVAVENERITGFKRGDQFNLPEGDRRPDDASESAEIVHEQRRRELEAGTTPITWRRLYPHQSEFATTA